MNNFFYFKKKLCFFLELFDFDVLFSGYLEDCNLVPGCFMVLRKSKYEEVCSFSVADNNQF